jgi:hypothetical protein
MIVKKSKKMNHKNWVPVNYVKNDLPLIASFFKELYKGQGNYGDMGLFHWKIVDNYIQPGIINLIKDGNRIASTTSITPKLLIFKGNCITAAEIGDTFTHYDYSRQGMFAVLINQSRQDAENIGINFVYGTPNDLSLPGYQKKANFNILQNLKVNSLLFPINIRHSVQNKSHWIIGSISSSIFSMLSYIFYKTKKWMLLLDKSIVIENISKVPPDWDVFWQKAKVGYDFIFNKNTEAVNWRYFKSPNKYRVMALRKNETLIGYAVIRSIHSEIGTYVTLADFLTLPGEEKALYTAIHDIIEHAYKVGAINVNLWCDKNSRYYKLFKTSGFIERGTIPVISYNNKFTEQFNNCTSWHFTKADSDNI